MMSQSNSRCPIPSNHDASQYWDRLHFRDMGRNSLYLQSLSRAAQHQVMINAPSLDVYDEMQYKRRRTRTNFTYWQLDELEKSFVSHTIQMCSPEKHLRGSSILPNRVFKSGFKTDEQNGGKRAYEENSPEGHQGMLKYHHVPAFPWTKRRSRRERQKRERKRRRCLKTFDEATSSTSSQISRCTDGWAPMNDYASATPVQTTTTGYVSNISPASDHATKEQFPNRRNCFMIESLLKNNDTTPPPPPKTKTEAVPVSPPGFTNSSDRRMMSPVMPPFNSMMAAALETARRNAWLEMLRRIYAIQTNFVLPNQQHFPISHDKVDAQSPHDSWLRFARGADSADSGARFS